MTNIVAYKKFYTSFKKKTGLRTPSDIQFVLLCFQNRTHHVKIYDGAASLWTSACWPAVSSVDICHSVVAKKTGNCVLSSGAAGNR